MKPVVLVTAIGTAASTAIVSSLAETNKYHIIGSDIYKKEQVATSKDVDEFYTFPSAVEDQMAYIGFAVDFCRKHHVSFYFPTIDEEVANLSANRSIFEEIGVQLCIPNDELVSICHYKDRFSQWIKSNMPQIAIETFCDPELIDESSFPLFIKPVEGRASNGCQKIENRAHLSQMIADGLNIGDYVVQPFMDGDIICVDLVRNMKTNQRAQIQRIERLRNSNGCGIAVQIINNKKLTAICDELMEKLNLNGVVNVELFQKGDEYRIIEVNPRFSAGTGFSMLAGLNTPLNAIEIASGSECVFGEIACEKHLAKRYEVYMLD